MIRSTRAKVLAGVSLTVGFSIGAGIVSVGASERRPPSETYSCHVAAQVLADRSDFSTGDLFDALQAPDIPLAESNARKFWEPAWGWKGEAPSADLANLWFKSTHTSVGVCANVKSMLLAGSPGQESRPSSASKPDPDARPPQFFISATLPVFNQARNRAVFLVRRHGDSLGGYLKIVLIAKDGDHWKRAGERIVSTS